MKKFLFIGICILLIGTNLISQQKESWESATKCDFEPDAPAVVIFDKGETMFVRDENGYSLLFKRHKRVKIFKESAFDQGEVSIPLYIGENDMEMVRDIKATTYFYNKSTVEKTELDPKQIYKEPINKYWYRKKFALPNLKEGCIIEYSYTVNTPYFTHLPDWEFQSEIPTVYSEYKTAMIPFFSYRYRAQGFSNFDVFNEKEKRGLDRQFMGLTFHDMVYTFGMKNLPSFNDESFISSKDDYIKKIDFQLSEINYPTGYSKKYMSTWPDLAKEFIASNDFGKYIKKAEKYGAKECIQIASLPASERVDAVINYVKKNFKPNGYTNKWASKSIKEFITEKTGNTANINLMALGILKAVGIDAKPVIISTRDHGKVTDSFPFSDLFNHVLILVDINDSPLLLDATNPYCPNNIIPANYCNDRGFIIEKDNERWVNIYNKTPSYEKVSLNYSLNPETNQITGTADVKCTGHISVAEKQKFEADSKKYTEQLEDKGLILKDSIELADFEKEHAFKYNINFESNVDQIGDQIILAPFLKLPIQENPFKQEKRDYGIDFIYPMVKSYHAQINIPDGYIVDELPKAYTKDSQNVAITFKAINKDNKTIILTASYHIKQPNYQASDYKELKQFYKEITQRFNENIVITRTGDLTQE